MTKFRSYHDVAVAEARRRRQIRTGLVVFIAILAIGWFSWDRPSYALGVIVTIVAGLIAARLAGDE